MKKALQLAYIVFATYVIAQVSLAVNLAYAHAPLINVSADEKSEESEDLVSLKFENDVSIQVEFANDPQTRALGLMYRREMCDDCGMLFKFDSVRIASIWMKNTYIPLDLAYINAFGKIVDIKQLKPHDLTSVPSSVPVLYALEMNEGWFETNGISVGDKITLPNHIK
ncbi:DUF192 domain-containing protein [Glaciecola sp. XM2]|jgi:uncharacterized membrane protein (UPF0127 family)|uniref:DUF192 domain-containing protein n=1 Tax=Glaciecola sp. XM2 TaxID=1914931 RepID=UPI001BDE61A8|nr:DUF192 domain-containing protein [Glaciecola sp. XM2]MBT1451048.1 DUF192 domain-containing protein [Glaciecola sp. XM2]